MTATDRFGSNYAGPMRSPPRWARTAWRRHERAGVGELVRVDVKKLGKIRGGVDGVGQSLLAVRLSSVEPGGNDGPYVATIVASEGTPRTCVGVVQVPEGKGTFHAQ